MNQKKIFALGFFDGVHLGHQALLTACRHLAERNNCKAGVVTFADHPHGLLAEQVPPLINTVRDRQHLILGYGMFSVTVLPFDRQMRNMPWQEFLEMLIQQGAVGFVCGEDFRFGFRGEGSAQILADFCKERNLSWAIVPDQKLDGIRISSTHIRGLLEAGEVARANRFLGHPHTLSGVVTGGKQLGRTIGFPTANLPLPDGVLVPKFGVYACKATVDGKTYPAVTNIGTRPTVNGQGANAECHLLDFSGDLYGKTLTLSFYKFLRPEKKFASLEELQGEIQKNIRQTREYFEKSE